MKFSKFPSPNYDKTPRSNNLIKFIVIHYTGMQSTIESLKRLTSIKSQVSCHYLLDREGKIIQLVEDNKNAWQGQSGAGGSTQFTKTIIDDGDGESGTQTESEDLTLSYSSSGSLGSVTLDLSIGSVATMLNLPGIYSANTLSLNNTTGGAITGDLSMAKIGLSYSYSNNTSQDFNDVYRALIQVGAIELIG